MTFKCTQVGMGVVMIISLAGCSESEQYSDISRDQLNHYAGIETHDHPVDNATASSVDNAEASKDEDRR